MRRWLTLFLLILLPLQFATAAAAAYCLHETDNSGKHLGHHEHEHQSPSATGVGDVPSDYKTLPSDRGDPDCGYCHLSCAQPLASVVQATCFEPATNTQSRQEPVGFGSRYPDPLERPNWSLAA